MGNIANRNRRQTKSRTGAGSPAMICAALILPLLTVACATHDHEHTAALQPREADAAIDDRMMSRINALEGEWEIKDENGAWVPASVFKVSSNGSVVREIMFPGTAHEMTNLYHMDGTDAVVTHYCAAGNQPRMVATDITQTPDGPAIAYEFESVSNLRPEHAHVMGSLRVVFLDNDHIRQEWTSTDQSGAVAGEMVFDLRRKK